MTLTASKDTIREINSWSVHNKSHGFFWLLFFFKSLTQVRRAGILYIDNTKTKRNQGSTYTKSKDIGDSTPFHSSGNLNLACNGTSCFPSTPKETGTAIMHKAFESKQTVKIETQVLMNSITQSHLSLTSKEIGWDLTLTLTPHEYL